METLKSNLYVKNIVDDYKTGDICYDELYQRDVGQWTKEQNSLLIDSIIKRYSIPALWFERTIKFNYNVIDGRQRINAIVTYINDGFKLDKDLDPVTFMDDNEDGDEVKIVEEIAGKKFSQLSKELQHRILKYPMDIILMLDYSEDEKEEQFYRLNNGSLFTKQQKATVDQRLHSYRHQKPCRKLP